MREKSERAVKTRQDILDVVNYSWRAFENDVANIVVWICDIKGRKGKELYCRRLYVIIWRIWIDDAWEKFMLHFLYKYFFFLFSVKISLIAVVSHSETVSLRGTFVASLRKISSKVIKYQPVQLRTYPGLRAFENPNNYRQLRPRRRRDAAPEPELPPAMAKR